MNRFAYAMLALALLAGCSTPTAPKPAAAVIVPGPDPRIEEVRYDEGSDVYFGHLRRLWLEQHGDSTTLCAEFTDLARPLWYGWGVVGQVDSLGGAETRAVAFGSLSANPPATYDNRDYPTILRGAPSIVQTGNIIRLSVPSWWLPTAPRRLVIIAGSFWVPYEDNPKFAYWQLTRGEGSAFYEPVRQ